MSTAVQSTGKNKKIDFLNGPLAWNIIKFSVPVMMSGILQHLYNAADIIVVGRFNGYLSQGAVSSVGSLVTLITTLFLGLSIGANVVVARHLGAREDDRVQRAVHTSVAISLIAGVIVSVTGFFMSRTFLEWMSSPGDIIGLSELYLRIFFLGSPASLFYNFGAAILRASGDTKRPLIFLSISGLLNVLLNILFVTAFNMNVAGVATATIISQYLSAVLVLITLMREKSAIRLSLARIRIYAKELLEIIKVGIPTGIQSTLFSFSNVIIQSSYNYFGSVTVAGVGAGANIDAFVYLPMNSVYQAALTFTSQNYGAKKYDRLKKVAINSTVIVSAFGIIIGLIVIVFGRNIAWLYTDTESVIDVAMIRVMVMGTTYFTCGIMDVGSGCLRGIDHAVYPMFVTIAGACGLRIVWIMTVFEHHKDLLVLLMSYPISWVVTSVALFLGYAYFHKKLLAKVNADSETDTAESN